MSRALPFLLLVLSATPAAAQEIPAALRAAELTGPLDEVPAPATVIELGLRNTRLVVKVSRHCRAGVCYRLIEYRQVVDTEADQDAEAGFPVRQASQPSRPAAAAVAAPSPAIPAARDNDQSLPAAPATASAESCGNQQETEAWSLLNAHRQALGLSALSCDLIALKTARAHSADMCSRQYFAHQSPEGAAPWDRLRGAGARFRSAGENIAMGYSTAADAHAGWLGSPGHRENIERASWTRAAVGLVTCAGVYYWTQLFAR